MAAGRHGWLFMASILASCGALRPLNPDGQGVGTGSETGASGGGDTAAAGGDADADQDADSDTDADTDAALSIASLSPAFGTNAGGTFVTIEGAGFDSSAVVKFGGVASASLPTITANEIVAVTPPNSATSYVDVTVTVGSQTGTLPGSYQYWADGTGLFGAQGELSYFQYEGTYWGANHITPPPYAFGQAWFTPPTPDHYWKALYAGALDTCASGYAPVIDHYSPGAPSLAVKSGNATITLAQDPNLDWDYWSNTIDAANDITLGGHYDVQPLAGADPDWPQFTGVDFAQIPSNDPRVTLPVIDGAQYATVTESSFLFNWNGPYDGDYVLILATRERAGASAYYQPVEYVSCVARDDGSFKIPSGTFAAWDTTQDAFFLALGRAVEIGGVLPYDNSTSGVVGVYWEQGFAVAR